MSVPRSSSGSGAKAKPQAPTVPAADSTPTERPAKARPSTLPLQTTPGEMPMGVAISTGAGEGGTVTARKAGGLRDMALEVYPTKVGVKAALQHLAKAVNIAFQTDFGENYLESVYQAAIVRRDEVHIIHREYFGFGDNWFGQFGRLIRSLQLTLEGPDPASPEGQQRIAEKGAVHDPRHPQLDRPQARPGRRVRRPRARLRRADVRPARGVRHHPRLGPQRLGDLDDPDRAGYSDRTQERKLTRQVDRTIAGQSRLLHIRCRRELHLPTRGRGQIGRFYWPSSA